MLWKSYATACYRLQNFYETRVRSATYVLTVTVQWLNQEIAERHSVVTILSSKRTRVEETHP